ncbi:hypothetical protein ACMD2_21687 [Ananas comosus]|uniref:Uncharacterized protein n=1 Tax=Ananas comosus TaxID=4615 RepID=A0A199V0Q8_ANACO|nr:hypothetical protein ACMD2_21687 [Ananas comosus]
MVISDWGQSPTKYLFKESGRTRAVFDVALKVHKNIQQRDIAVGRNLGNSILRWLDRLKPSAQIRPHPSSTPTNGSFSSRNVSAHNQSLKMQKPNTKAAKDQESSSQLHFTSWNVRPKSFPTIAMMTQPARPSGMNSQYRRFSFLPSYGSYCSVSERRRDLLAGPNTKLLPCYSYAVTYDRTQFHSPSSHCGLFLGVGGHRNPSPSPPIPAAMATAAAAAAATAAEPQMPGLLKSTLLGLHDVAVGKRFGVPQRVVAEGVGHVPLPELAHRTAPLRRHHGQAGGRELRVGGSAVPGSRRRRLERVDAAAEEGEVGEFGDEGAVLVVDLVAAAGRGPVRGVPDGGVERHRLRRVVAAHDLRPTNLPDRNVVNVETEPTKKIYIVPNE